MKLKNTSAAISISIIQLVGALRNLIATLNVELFSRILLSANYISKCKNLLT